MRKRRYQTGSLKPAKKGGRKVWYAQWWEDGHHRAKILGPISQVTKSEAQASLAAILAPLNAGLTATAGKVVAVGEFIEKTYLPWQEMGWKESTAATTTQRVRSLILPAFRSRLLRSITREDLQEFLVLKAQTQCASVVRHLRWDLNSIFRLAQSDGLTLTNPAAALRAPRKCKAGRPKRALTEAEVLVYLKALDIRERLMARLAIVEGMRPGEIFSLQWADMDGAGVFIARRVYQGQFDTPKGNRSRMAALSDGTAELLREWHGVCSTPQEEGWVFASARPTSPLRPDNTWKKWFAPKLTKVGLEWASFQALRKTNATLMQKYGADAKAGADQRGHGVGVSLAVYTESGLSEKKAAVQALEDALEKLESPPPAEKVSA